MTQKKKETIGSVLMYIALALTAIYLVFAIISLFGIVGMKNDFAKLGAHSRRISHQTKKISWTYIVFWTTKASTQWIQ